MPTAHKRIQVLLTPEQYEVVHELAKATRLSMSRIVSDIVEPSVPLLVRSRQMLQNAAKLTEEARAALRPDLDKHEKDLRLAASAAYEALAETEATIRRAGGDGAKRKPRPPAVRRRRPSPR